MLKERLNPPARGTTPRQVQLLKVAIVHDWLTGMRGGERVLEVFCELFPNADLYTLIYRPHEVSPLIQAMKVRVSWINRLPGIQNYYRYFLPLFPSAIERFDFKGYDLILSSSHCVAKGIHPRGALHVSYVHAPLRYVWDMYELYFGPDAPWIHRLGMALCRSYLRRWDLRSSERVSFYIANSNNVAGKIKKLYGWDASVIHPPVDTDAFHISRDQAPYYLIVSALVPYKNINIAIEAFNRLKLPLKIAGDGPLRQRLAKNAGSNIEFLGWVDRKNLSGLYASCQSLIFPGEEDFGIAPLEAQASGRPVIAYGRGGVLETVVPFNSPKQNSEMIPSPTGIFFHEPTPESLIQAIEVYRNEKDSFDPAKLRRHACGFSRDRFKTQIKEQIGAQLQSRQGLR